jgi:biotin operon repressor
MKQTARWKGRVLKDVQRQRQAKTKLFKSKYDKLRIWEPSKNPNMMNHRYLPKEFILQPISLSAKGIYPVLCYMADFKKDKKFQVSQANIGRMAGIKSWATIKKALQELMDVGYVRAELVQGERHFYVYEVSFIRMDEGTLDEKQLRKGTFYRFNTSIIEAGIWAQLTTRQQVFYQALRSAAVIDPEEEEYFWENNAGDTSYAEFYANHQSELFVGSTGELCKQVGLSRANVKRVVYTGLQKFKLMQPLTTGGKHSCIQVYLHAGREKTAD